MVAVGGTARSTAAGAREVCPRATFITANCQPVSLGSAAPPFLESRQEDAPRIGQGHLSGVARSSPLGSTGSPVPRCSPLRVLTPLLTSQAPPLTSKPAEGLARSRASTDPVPQSSSDPIRPPATSPPPATGARPNKRRQLSRTLLLLNGLKQAPPKDHHVSIRRQQGCTGLMQVRSAQGRAPGSSLHPAHTSLLYWGISPLLQGSSGRATAPPRGALIPSPPLCYAPLHAARLYRRAARLSGPRPCASQSQLAQARPLVNMFRPPAPLDYAG
ncbi:hypothetical protein NDU88_001968 [Pleurodeles waltl]|uniref:Uncharacterized protein n=1 Tax=Pleurodeles waltl TaxID=8319 RepID=A0AAV7TKF7_PLEWA|nr:hypothetical protein NDU88_001968 [Pleurodeles waltl]